MLPLITALAPMVSSIIDKVVPDTAAAEKAKAEITNSLIANANEIEKAAASIVLGEVNGQSWLQRNWRPLLMLFFAGLIGADWFGFRPEYMTEAILQDVYDLLKIGIGGYIVGRSGEKIMKEYKK